MSNVLSFDKHFAQLFYSWPETDPIDPLFRQRTLDAMPFVVLPAVVACHGRLREIITLQCIIQSKQPTRP